MADSIHSVYGGKVETDAIVSVPAESTSQLNKCSRCGHKIQCSRLSYQSRPGDYKVCTNCERTEGFAHPAHVSHFLFLVNLANQIWRCNACEKLSSEINGSVAYICDLCKFYLCQSCFEPKKYLLHDHTLTKTDSKCVYPGTLGRWKCDCCGGNNGEGNYFPRHCNICNFDVCDKCCEPRHSTLHLHELRRADSSLIYERFNGGWRCDDCSSRFHPLTNKFPYHCDTCEFDLCDTCMRVTDSKAPRAHAYNQSSMLRTTARTAAGFPVASPEEDMRNASKASSAVADDTKCIICLTEPKNATIIHGSTGHVSCCVNCARELEQRGNACPICRKPIQCVIQHYYA